MTARADLLAEIEANPIKHAPKFLEDDCTPEKLAIDLSNHQESLAIISSEGGNVEAFLGIRYGNGGSNLDLALKAYSGDALKVSRISRPPVELARPRLAVGLCIQPETMDKLRGNSELIGRGLLARFLIAIPRSPVGERRSDTPAPDAEIESQFQGMMRSSIEGTIALDTGERFLSFSPEAWETFRREIVDHLEPRLGLRGDLYAIQGWAGKLSGAMARLIGIVHLAEGQSGDVSPATVQKVLPMKDYLIAHARAFFEGIAGSDAGMGIRFQEWLRKDRLTRFTERDLYRRFPKIQDSARRGLFLDEVEARGLARQVETERLSGPGRRGSTTWEINPRLMQ